MPVTIVSSEEKRRARRDKVIRRSTAPPKNLRGGAPCPSPSFTLDGPAAGPRPYALHYLSCTAPLRPSRHPPLVPLHQYTQKNQEGKLPGTGVFPASGVAGPNPNPFGKNSAFSRPIRDPFKTVSDE